MRLTFAKSTRRHRIGRARAVQAIRNAVFVATVDAPSDDMDDRILFLGRDDSEPERPFEIMAIDLGDNHLYVIHVQDIRDKYRDLYEEGKNR